jgi:hypothetical protein
VHLLQRFAFHLQFHLRVLLAQRIADERSRREAISHYRAGQELMSAEKLERAAEEFSKAIDNNGLFTLAHAEVEKPRDDDIPELQDTMRRMAQTVPTIRPPRCYWRLAAPTSETTTATKPKLHRRPPSTRIRNSRTNRSGRFTLSGIGAGRRGTIQKALVRDRRDIIGKEASDRLLVKVWNKLDPHRTFEHTFRRVGCGICGLKFGTPERQASKPWCSGEQAFPSSILLSTR